MSKSAPIVSPAQALAAEAWSEAREPLDRQLSPLGLQAIAALMPRPGEAILDVGCGAGQTVLQLAECVGSSGAVVGVDIASGLLAIARRRAQDLPQASFLHADAANLDLPDGTFDALYSRFGVMAFSDPVAAFSNLRRMLKPEGRLGFVCWRGVDENELDILPLRAADLANRVDPAPFSFEDPTHVREVLEVCGFRNVAIAAHDQPVVCGDLETTISVLVKVGALGRILRADPARRPQAEMRVRTALAARGDEADVALGAAVWIVTAQA